MENIVVRIEIFKENDQYIALSPELNVSSFGDTPKKAKASLSEAISLFVEECGRMGTLNEILEEAGFTQESFCYSYQNKHDYSSNESSAIF